jgi:2-polyprenyl-6-methoxyphenol hydroxylase-like FAD-dependent oxidoreductase
MKGSQRWRAAAYRSGPNQLAGIVSRILAEEEVTADRLEREFPGCFPPWMASQMAVELRRRSGSHLGGTTICSQLHVGESIVLIGDAGHPMTITQGFGCNTALESASVLCCLLERSLKDGSSQPHRVPAMFSSVRLRDAHGVQRLETMFATHMRTVVARSAAEKWHASLGVLLAMKLDALSVKLGRRGAKLAVYNALRSSERREGDVFLVLNALRWSIYSIAFASILYGLDRIF